MHKGHLSKFTRYWVIKSHQISKDGNHLEQRLVHSKCSISTYFFCSQLPPLKNENETKNSVRTTLCGPKKTCLRVTLAVYSTSWVFNKYLSATIINGFFLPSLPSPPKAISSEGRIHAASKNLM